MWHGLFVSSSLISDIAAEPAGVPILKPHIFGVNLNGVGEFAHVSSMMVMTSGRFVVGAYANVSCFNVTPAGTVIVPVTPDEVAAIATVSEP
jgi:hypothetical protein